MSNHAKNRSKNGFIPLGRSRYSQNYLNGVKRGLNGIKTIIRGRNAEYDF
jgi:hypothetical protein